MVIPFLFPFLFLTGGVVFEDFTGISVGLVWILIFLLVIFLFNGIKGYVFFLIFLFLIGTFISHEESIRDFKRKGVFVGCIVSSVPKLKMDKIIFKCDVFTSEYDDLKNKKILVVLKSNSPFESEIFYRSYIFFIGNISSKDSRIFAFPRKDFVSIKNDGNIFYPVWNFKKYLVGNFLDKTEDKDQASLGLALIFGEKGFLDRDLKDTFIDSGLTHLLAISGLHVGIIVTIIFFIFSFLHKKVIYILTGFVLILYPFFTGFYIPVVRASLMGVMYIFAKIKYLRVDTINILFFVAFLVILVDPKSVYSPSFQLSFLAVFGILISLKYIILDHKSKVISVIYSMFSMSVIAVLFTMPIVIYHFGKFSLASIISTPVSMIFIYPYLFLSLINILTMFKVPLFVDVMNWTGMFFIKTAEFFDRLDLFSSGYSPDFITVFLYLLFISILIIVNFNIYLKFGFVAVGTILFLIVSKTDLEGYRLYVIEGYKKPDFFLVSEDRRCFIFWRRERYSINILMDRYRCREKILLSDSREIFHQFDYVVFRGESYKGLKFLDNKGISIKVGERVLNIENETYVLNIQ
ncbi:ComEC/Rec2 family competence protein [Persephonella sp.]